MCDDARNAQCSYCAFWTHACHTRVCVTHTAEVPARPAGASELVAAGPSRCPLALRSSRWAESGARPQVPAALRAQPPRGPPWPAHTPAEGPPSLPGGGGTHPSPSFALPSVLFLSPGPRGVSRDSCSAGGRVGVPGAGRGSRGGRAGPPQATPAPHLFLERSAPSPGAGEAAAQGRAPRASRGGVPPIAVVQASATHEAAQRLCSPRWHSTLVLDRDVQVNATKRNAAHRAASRQDATRRRDANATP